MDKQKAIEKYGTQTNINIKNKIKTYKKWIGCYIFIKYAGGGPTEEYLWMINGKIQYCNGSTLFMFMYFSTPCKILYQDNGLDENRGKSYIENSRKKLER